MRRSMPPTGPTFDRLYLHGNDHAPPGRARHGGAAVRDAWRRPAGRTSLVCHRRRRRAAGRDCPHAGLLNTLTTSQSCMTPYRTSMPRHRRSPCSSSLAPLGISSRCPCAVGHHRPARPPQGRSVRRRRRREGTRAGRAQSTSPTCFIPIRPGGLHVRELRPGVRRATISIRATSAALQIWDIADPTHPVMVACRAVLHGAGRRVDRGTSRSSCVPRIARSRLDCGMQGVKDSVSTERMRRHSDLRRIRSQAPKAGRAMCRPAADRTRIPWCRTQRQRRRLHLRVGPGAACARAPRWPGCVGTGVTDPNSVLFRIEAIRVPLAHPEQAKIVSSPRIFNDLAAPPTHGIAYADTAHGAALHLPARFLPKMPAQRRGSRLRAHRPPGVTHVPEPRRQHEVRILSGLDPSIGRRADDPCQLPHRDAATRTGRRSATTSPPTRPWDFAAVRARATACC